MAYFTTIVEKYQIKRYGPALNKFREDDLHKFMENPAYFLPSPKINVNKVNPKKPKGFTSIKI
jgi:hypothetical protein